MIKKIIIAAGCLCLLLFIVIGQDNRQAGQPYTTSCTSKEDRCRKCKLYELQMKKLQGNISDEDFRRDSLAEADYINRNCSEPIPCCLPRPTDSCENRRGFSLTVSEDKLDFSVCRNEIKNGECNSTNDCKVILSVGKSPMISAGNSKRRFESQFVSYASPDNNIKFLGNDCYRWTMSSDKAEYPDSEFAFLVPDSISNLVWLVKPVSIGSNTGKKYQLPGSIKANWFSYYSRKENPNLEFVFEDIITVFSHDPNAEVIFVVDSPAVKKLILGLKVNYQKKEDMLCIGYSKGEHLSVYQPFNLPYAQDITHAIMANMAGNGNIDPRLRSMIINWSKGSTQEFIRSVLPAIYNERSAPLSAIGDPHSGDCLSADMTAKIRSGAPVDLLTYRDDEYYCWRSGNEQHQSISWLNKDLSDHCQFRSLGIADPGLKKITYAKDSLGIKLIFFFREQPYNLYCWTIANEAFTENVVLKGNDLFQLTGNPCLQYLVSLKSNLANDEEQRFFVLHSGGNSFQLLDAFNLENKEERIILWSRDLQPVLRNNILQTKVEKLGNNLSIAELNFFITDSKDISWVTFQLRYNTGSWIREKLFGLNVYTDIHTKVDCWFSRGNKFGMTKYNLSEKLVAVYLDPQHRELFGAKSFAEIIKQIKTDQVIYHGSNSGGQPTEQEFFESCLAPGWNNWNKKIWRANPLGYFDRL